MARQCGKPFQFPGADDLVADQYVLDAGRNQRFGFAGFLATDADRAKGDLPQRNGRRLVHLGVWAQAQVPVFGKGRHAQQIALEHGQLDDQGRGVDIPNSHADRSGCRPGTLKGGHVEGSKMKIPLET